MSVAHLTPPVAAPSLHSAMGALRARGMRVSAARRSILAALYAVQAPLTADELAGDGDVASVYRNLDALEALGLVRHVHAGHGPGRYTIIGASGEVEFLACERCHTVEVIDPARLDGPRALIERELGLRPRFTHFPLVGLCAGCATAARAPGSGWPAGRSGG